MHKCRCRQKMERCPREVMKGITEGSLRKPGDYRTRLGRLPWPQHRELPVWWDQFLGLFRRRSLRTEGFSPTNPEYIIRSSAYHSRQNSTSGHAEPQTVSLSSSANSCSSLAGAYCGESCPMVHYLQDQTTQHLRRFDGVKFDRCVRMHRSCVT